MPGLAQPGPGAVPKANAPPHERMNYGRFLSATVTAAEPAGNIAVKGIAIKLGKGQQAAVCFDTEVPLRAAAALRGCFSYSRSDEALRLESPESRVDRADRQATARALLDLHAHGHAVGVRAQANECQQHDLLQRA